MMTTRRLDEREARDSAARRPRPKVERPTVPLLRLKVWPRWPAFFAALITSPTKGLRSLGAPVAVTDAAGARVEVVVPRRHVWERFR